MKHIRMAAAILLGIVVGPLSLGDVASASTPASPSATRHALTTSQRVDIARSLAQIWAPEMRRRGGDVRQWATKLGRFVGTADAANVRLALEMPTFDTMMGVLQGQPLESDSIQSALKQAADVGIESLGSTIRDATYTPLPNGRCRVADSRVIFSPISGGASRAIDVESVGSYASQGGNGTFANGDGSANCGLPEFATALAVSVTVLSTGNEGFFKIHDFSKPFQTGSTVYYTGTVSASNDVIVTACQTCANELSIYSSAAVHYVIDVVGYFAPNQATALECTYSQTSTAVAASGTFSFQIPNCPSGYTMTGAACQTSSFNDVTWGRNGLHVDPLIGMMASCMGVNKGATGVTVQGAAQCCRVPGR